jgi:hypothetical protein
MPQRFYLILSLSKDAWRLCRIYAAAELACSDVA